MLKRFQGCLLGLALGDALGAPYEGGPLERVLWRMIGRTREGKMRWTDDTQMSLDVAESLIALGRVAPDDMARRFGASYRWSRGYGPGAAKVLKRIKAGQDWRTASRAVYPEGSFGNGGAMRAPVLGLFCAGRPAEIAATVGLVASITHAHVLAIDGAVLIATATALALNGKDGAAIMGELEQLRLEQPYRAKLKSAANMLAAEEDVALWHVRNRLGHGIAAIDSCVTALYFALRYLERPFVEMHARIARNGGDADTIGAMAGAIWGAANGSGKLPQAGLDRLEQGERVLEAANALHRLCQLKP